MLFGKKILLLMLVIIAGCSSGPSSDEKISAYYGNIPLNHESTIKNYMEDRLFDPFSAQYKNWRGPAKGFYGSNFMKTVYGWRVCTDINAKNRYGAYTGFETNQFIIRDDNVVYRLPERDAQKFCNF